jgi:hypothetical protein
MAGKYGVGIGSQGGGSIEDLSDEELSVLAR